MRPMAVWRSWNFWTGLTPGKRFQMATSRAAGQGALRSASSCWLVKVTQGGGAEAGASSGVPPATISFCWLSVKVMVLGSPLVAAFLAVMPWIARKRKESKRFLGNLWRGERRA